MSLSRQQRTSYVIHHTMTQKKPTMRKKYLPRLMIPDKDILVIKLLYTSGLYIPNLNLFFHYHSIKKFKLTMEESNIHFKIVTVSIVFLPV